MQDVATNGPRKFSQAEKKKIVQESHAVGVTVTSIAEKYGIPQTRLSEWRSRFSGSGRSKKGRGDTTRAESNGAEIKRLEARVMELEAAYGRLALKRDEKRSP